MIEDPAERHRRHRRLLDPFRAALYDADLGTARAALEAVTAPGSRFQLAHPFEDLDGAGEFLGMALEPLAAAWPDLERRDVIVMAGVGPDGSAWIGCGGAYHGTFVGPWLGMPPTGLPTAMRFHEFYRVEDGRVVEMQALWDLPEVMMQAGAWPLSPSLGREWPAPAPATQDGLPDGPWDEAASTAAADHVVEMLGDMGRYPTEPAEAMRLEHWWHPRFSWYGPAGIGTGRGVDGFRRFHQTPFLNAMPDRRGGGYVGRSHVFGDGNYVGLTAWPGMEMTLSGDGWLGIPPLGRPITMRSLDFWRIEVGAGADGERRPLIRENWVLVDLLHVYDQIGVDVLARMRELAGRLP